MASRCALRASLLTAASFITIIQPAFGQTATATATGTGVSRSTSASRATAISGQGGTGVGTVTVNNTPSNTPAVVLNQNTPATQTIKNVPTEFAPGLAAAGLETCLGSISGGGAFVGTGFSFGSTIPDPGCAARLDARTLWSFGLKKAAIARLCLNNDVYRAMPDVCYQYLPQAVPAGVVVPTRLATVGNVILLVDGKTGKDRYCKDYDEPGQRCRVWADAVSHASKKLASRDPNTQAVKPSSKQSVPIPPASTSLAEDTEGKSK